MEARGSTDAGARVDENATRIAGVPAAVAATFALAQSFVGRARASRHRFMERDAWRFENCVALKTHRPDFVVREPAAVAQTRQPAAARLGRSGGGREIRA